MKVIGDLKKTPVRFYFFKRDATLLLFVNSGFLISQP